MKSILLFLTFVLCNTFSFAQCEKTYFPFEDGVSFELTNYKSNGKETGKVKSTIRDTDQENRIIVQNEIYDKKGKLISDGEYEVICDNGTVKIDMKRFIPEDLMKGHENMEMVIEGDFMEIPASLEVGQELPDGSGTITMSMSGGGMDMKTTMDLTFTDMKVEKEETITTPAGTFETFKITQTTNVDMNMVGMKKTTTTTSANWLAKGVGTVKTENYDKKGKVDSYTELTSFEGN